MDEQPDRPPDGELSRSDLRDIRGALRQDWPIPPDVKKRILQRIVNFLDPDTIEGGTASGRTVLMAARTLAAYCDLVIRQQAVDLAREKHEGKNDRDVTLADVVRAAEARAEERKRERDEG